MQVKLKLNNSYALDKVNSHTEEALSDATKVNKRIQQLQGQCRIKKVTILQFDLLKTILLIIPIVLSVIGLLLIKYYKSLRVLLFYKISAYSQATHLYIQNQDEQGDIQPIIRQSDKIYVIFKNLKYYLHLDRFVPVGYQFQLVFHFVSSIQYIKQGINQQLVKKRQKQYGKNEHKVEIIGYFEYMFDILTKPFFLLQYVICVIFAFQKLYIYLILYIVFSILTTSINYILLYISFKKIKDMAQRQFDVTVIRQSKQIIIKNHQIVPGDVVIPKNGEQISYDGILIQGQIFVNEASLTGQNIPIGKFQASNLLATQKDTCWLYEGAKVLDSRSNSRVLVVNTGYTTRRGRIIRKILHRQPKNPQFFKSAVYFLIQTCIVGIILYLVTLPLMINNVITAFIVFRFLDVLAWSFPPTFPIFFNVCYSFSLIRLKWRNVFGTQPQKCPQAANMKTFCFDKTGTLTQNQLQLYQIYHFGNINKNIKGNQLSQQNALIYKLFSSCHAVKNINNELMGDEVDLKMYIYSGFQLKSGQNQNCVFYVQNKQMKIKVLKLNQFQSKFQNMSVLVHDLHSNRYFIFVKGAPQRIHNSSRVKINNYDKLIEDYSLGGYRTIAYGYRQIKQNEVKQFLQKQRQQYQKNIEILGLISFQNKLKKDTAQTISRLRQSDIQPKMITGDNIFIAVEIGYRSGIINSNQQVILVQGKKNNNSRQVIRGIKLNKIGDKINRSQIQISYQQYHASNQKIFAVDNDFITNQGNQELSQNIRIFARISPQNKSEIVKKYKNKYINQFNQRPYLDKLLSGGGRWKVGMCGDGANDLMAIREADIGVGISNSDASYASSFSIINILDAELIVRQSKNVTQAIVDTIRYFGTISFLKIIAAILLVSDVTYFSSTSITYYNFAHSIFLAIFIGLSTPSQKPTKYRPNNNLLSLENHLIYWINVIFPTIGFCAGYFYFKSTNQFIENPLKVVTFSGGYSGIKCHTHTIVWLLINLPYIANALTCYTSSPFKESFFKNIPIFILSLINIILAILYFFVTETIQKTFDFLPVSSKNSVVVLVIMLVSLAIGCMLTQIIRKKIIK